MVTQPVVSHFSRAIPAHNYYRNKDEIKKGYFVTQCLAINGSKMKLCISKMVADVKLCTSLFGVITLPGFFLPGQDHSGTCAWHWRAEFCLIEEMFSVRWKVDYVLWLAELKSHSHV